MPQTPKPIHFLKAYDISYSKMNKENKYKDKDEYKYKYSPPSPLPLPREGGEVKKISPKEFLP